MKLSRSIAQQVKLLNNTARLGETTARFLSLRRPVQQSYYDYNSIRQHQFLTKSNYQYKFSTTPQVFGNPEHRRNNERLKRKVNLGNMIQTLQNEVPNLLTDQLSSSGIIAKDMILRLLPNQYPNLPVFKGYVISLTTLKTLSLILTSFYLNPMTKLHITSIQIIEPTDSTLCDNDLIRLSINNNSIELPKLDNVNKQFLSNYTTKIIFKWRTCATGCTHLNNSKTMNASKGSFNIDHFDISKLIPPIKLAEDIMRPEISSSHQNKVSSESDTKTNNSSSNSNSKSNAEVSSLFKGTSDDYERLLSGIFIFELNNLNDEIVVFTIDNCEILENKQSNINTDLGLAA